MSGELSLLEEVLNAEGQRAYGDTDEFREFLRRRRCISGGADEPQYADAQGFRYVCKAGTLIVENREGEEVWRSDPYWYVDRFALADVDGDGLTDFVYTLWKSYSFYKDSEIGRAGKDDPAVRQHLFYSTIRCGRVKMEWCSSNLPRPIYEFSLCEGTPNAAGSGVALRTLEGFYTEDGRRTEAYPFLYTWEGWGFVMQDEE